MSLVNIWGNGKKESLFQVVLMKWRWGGLIFSLVRQAMILHIM
jgi:hypothetical protein